MSNPTSAFNGIRLVVPGVRSPRLRLNDFAFGFEFWEYLGLFDWLGASVASDRCAVVVQGWLADGVGFGEVANRLDGGRVPHAGWLGKTPRAIAGMASHRQLDADGVSSITRGILDQIDGLEEERCRE